MSDVLAVRGLKRSFRQGEVVIHVLNGVDLDVGNGEIVALLGPSGSGKSTLLQAVGLLEGGFEGSIRINGEEAAQLDNDGRTRLRRDALGFVYQFHHLLPDFNAAENVIIPQLIHGADNAASAWCGRRAAPRWSPRIMSGSLQRWTELCVCTRACWSSPPAP